MVARGRWVLAGSLIAPVLFSGYAWLCCLVLAPTLLAAFVAGSVLIVVLRDVPAVFCWWYGIRPPSGSERDVVLEALVPARSLRGRRQPRVWIGVRGDRHARRIAALTPGDLAVSEGMLIGLLDRRLDPAEVTALTLHALGSRGVQGRGSVMVGELFLLPWVVPSVVASHLVDAAGGLPLVGLLWRARFVTAGIAMVLQVQDGRPWNVVGVAAVLAWTYLHPWCRSRWAACLQRAGDDRVTAEGFGPAYARMLRRTTVGGLAFQHRLARLESSTAAG